MSISNVVVWLRFNALGDCFCLNSLLYGLRLFAKPAKIAERIRIFMGSPSLHFSLVFLSFAEHFYPPFQPR